MKEQGLELALWFGIGLLAVWLGAPAPAPKQASAEVVDAIAAAEARIERARAVLEPRSALSFAQMPAEVRPDAMTALAAALPAVLDSEAPNPNGRRFVALDCAQPPCLLVFEEALAPTPGAEAEEAALDAALDAHLSSLAAWGRIGTMTRGNHPAPGRSTLYYWAAPPADDPQGSARVLAAVQARTGD